MGQIFVGVLIVVLVIVAAYFFVRSMPGTNNPLPIPPKWNRPGTNPAPSSSKLGYDFVLDLVGYKLAFELGYRASERGENLEEALRKLSARLEGVKKT